MYQTCGCGKSDVGEALFNLATYHKHIDNVNLYMNVDYSVMTIPYKNVKSGLTVRQSFNFDNDLTSDEKFEYGWDKIYKDDLGEVIRENMGSKVPLANSQTGKVEWNEKKKKSESSTETKGDKSKNKPKSPKKGGTPRI